MRVPELAAYQDLGYAERYAGFVARVRVAEDQRTPGRTELTEAVARNLFKLMAYKDEYEVARLHLDTVERAKLDRELGAGAKVAFNLHPPMLRAMGLDRKLKLGPWFLPAFRTLRGMRRLRGTRLDPFGTPRCGAPSARWSASTSSSSARRSHTSIRTPTTPPSSSASCRT